MARAVLIIGDALHREVMLIVGGSVVFVWFHCYAVSWHHLAGNPMDGVSLWVGLFIIWWDLHFLGGELDLGMN